jgi:peptide deformylase
MAAHAHPSLHVSNLADTINELALASEIASDIQATFYMRYLGDVELTQPTKRLVDVTDIPYGLIDAMRHANGHAWAEGLGLSANQVGASLRLAIAMFTDPAGQPTRKNPTPRREVLLINPRIIDASPETTIMVEGCLSVPNFRANLKRHTWVVLEYRDEGFQRQQLRVEGMDAQIVQHEIDHLDGKLITDGLSRQQRRQAERQTAKVTGGTK